MDHSGSSPFLIESPGAVRALSSPIRQEIVDAVVAAGPCTIAALAQHLGRAPDSLYFHVRRLLAVGLLIERDAARRGRHVAAVYDVPGRPMRIAYDGRLSKPAGRRSINAVVQGAIRLGSRDFARAVESGTSRTSGAARDLWGGRSKGWLSDADLAELNTLVERASEILRAGRPGKGRRPISLTFVLAPVKASARTPPLAEASGASSPRQRPHSGSLKGVTS